LRRLVYRPRLVDAQMTDTPDIIFTHEFYYRPSDVPETPPPAPAEGDAPAEEDAPVAKEDDEEEGNE